VRWGVGGGGGVLTLCQTVWLLFPLMIFPRKGTDSVKRPCNVGHPGIAPGGGGEGSKGHLGP